MLIDQLMNLDHKLSIVAAGCGAYFAQLLNVPGISKWLHDIHLLYDTECIRDYFADNKINKFVTHEMSNDLSLFYYPKKVYRLGITASLPTNRERKGDNLAYLSLSYDGLVLGSVNLVFEKEVFDSNLQMARRAECDKYFCEEGLKWALSIIQTVE